MAFEGLELTQGFCFGAVSSNPVKKAESWVSISELSETRGWRDVDVGRLEESLASDVDQSYASVATGFFHDVESDMKWTARFSNDRALWELTLEGQPDVEVTPDQKKEFFGSEAAKAFAARVCQFFARAKRQWDKVIDYRMGQGELLKVDPIKSERVIWVLNDERSMENLRTLKFAF